MQADVEVNATGLNCPLPILKAKKAMAGLQSGQILRVIATDPGSMHDFTAYARQQKHQMLEAREESDRFYYVMKKA